MDIPTLRKVIELYLRGFGYQEISKRTGIARSTVQDTVNRWREGQTGIFDQALSYVDDITDIARGMRQNGTRIEDLKMPFLNASVLRGLNVDLQELYSFYDAVRGYGPDVLPAMAKTVIALQSRGMDPAGMMQKLESLDSEIKEMETKKDHLLQDVSAVDKELKEKIRSVSHELGMALDEIKQKDNDFREMRDDRNNIASINRVLQSTIEELREENESLREKVNGRRIIGRGPGK